MVAPEGPERMLTSRLGKANKRAAAAGFTLIELLVVVTIVAILSLGVGLSVGGTFARPSDSPAAIAERFTQAITQARDRALMGRVAVGFRPLSGGWQRERVDAEGVWQTLGAPDAVEQASLSWLVDTRSYLPGFGTLPRTTPPPVLFLPDGRNPVVSVTISAQSARVVCDVDGWGGVECR